MPDPIRAAFAVPGDISKQTGGYLYDRRLIEALRAQGLDVTHLALPDSFPRPSAGDMAASMAQLSALPAGMPVIVDGLAYGAMDYAALSRLDRPLIALVHHPLAMESGLPADEARALRISERANLALARHVLVPSPHTRRVLIEEYDIAARDITIARPGVVPPEVLPQRPRRPGPLRILSVGLQHPRKGHDLLLRALAGLADLPWTAVIAGMPWDIDHARALAQMIPALGLEGRVELAGLVPDGRLQRLYAEADLFALATRYEGHGLVFDEALQRGLPIVSCATGAVPDTVPQGAGLLVAPDDVPALAEALRQLIADEDARDACAAVALRAGRDLPDWPMTAHAVAEVLGRVAARLPARPGP